MAAFLAACYFQALVAWVQASGEISGKGRSHKAGSSKEPKVWIMANTTSAKKAVRKIARRTEVNKMRRTRMRGLIRKVEEAVAAGDKSKANEALKTAQPEIMRAAGRGILHKNTASRKISRLAHRISKLESA